nr:hypothetical protein [Nocardia gamkensis]
MTFTAPATPGGTTAVIWVAETMVNEVAAVAPKVTAVAPVRLVPVSVTVFAPELGPWLGLTPLTEGTPE